jgi:hypothetical protein
MYVPIVNVNLSEFGEFQVHREPVKVGLIVSSHTCAHTCAHTHTHTHMRAHARVQQVSLSQICFQVCVGGVCLHIHARGVGREEWGCVGYSNRPIFEVTT